MLATKEESEFERIRKENMKRNEEEFNKLFPVSLLKVNKSTTPRSAEIRQNRRRNLHNLVHTLTPRESLRRSCKRERDPSPDTFSDSEGSNSSTGSGVVVKFGNWGKRFKSLKESADGLDDKDFVCDDEDIDDVNNNSRYSNKSYRRSASPQKRSTKLKNQSQRPFEAVTVEDLVLVADRTSDKHYDQVDGTSCHQCRQKTDDLKTVCRSGRCVGIRGQFCGPCLKNRYGECAKAAIMNPEWECPPCRGICNCSFCMKKRGRHATGILIHAAKKQGYTSVSSFLDLKEKVLD